MVKITFKRDSTKGYNKHNIFIEKGVLVKKGTSVWSGNIVLGKSVLEKCELLPNNHIENALIYCNAKIGPFARIRPNTTICENCKIGNFVEIKNSFIGENTKISHLTYVGDAEIGQDCNLGCGTVFCNYDGEYKHRCRVGDRVFIGSNSNLIAPLEIGNDCIIASGTVVTNDMPNSTFCIGRVKQENRKNKKVK